jgi:hypothetical protein
MQPMSQRRSVLARTVLGPGHEMSDTAREGSEAMNGHERIRVEPYSVESPLRPRKVLRKTWSHSLATRLLSAALLRAGMLDLAEDGECGSTSPSAEVPDVAQYVALHDGLYRFDRRRCALALVVPGDFLGLCTPGLSLEAPESAAPAVVFLHVGPAGHPVTTALAADLYLFASSQGLACWPHDCDRAGIAPRLGLSDPARILFAQTVRFPAPQATTVRPFSSETEEGPLFVSR